MYNILFELLLPFDQLILRTYFFALIRNHQDA